MRPRSDGRVAGHAAGVVEAGVATNEFETSDTASVAWQILGMIDGLNAQALVRWDGVNDRGTHLARAVEGMVGAARGSLQQHAGIRNAKARLTSGVHHGATDSTGGSLSVERELSCARKPATVTKHVATGSASRNCWGSDRRHGRAGPKGSALRN